VFGGPVSSFVEVEGSVHTESKVNARASTSPSVDCLAPCLELYYADWHSNKFFPGFVVMSCERQASRSDLNMYIAICRAMGPLELTAHEATMSIRSWMELDSCSSEV